MKNNKSAAKKALTVPVAISNLDSDSNVLIAVNDKYNSNKIWIVRKYKSGHYSLQQAIVTEGKEAVNFSKVVRMRKQYITELVGELE